MFKLKLFREDLYYIWMSVIPQQKDLRLVKIVESSDKDSSSQAKVSVSELSEPNGHTLEVDCFAQV